MSIETVSPAGILPAIPHEFVWRSAAGAPFTVVLMDAAYREIGRFDAIADDHVEVDGHWRAAMTAGGVFHWTVAGTVEGRRVGSPTEQFEIR
ncbi:MAG: hypothetical protein KDC98_24470 [Planctomycetes bacterium]|nr:hypothetical protein [Planctomycetota bacterium]